MRDALAQQLLDVVKSHGPRSASEQAVLREVLVGALTDTEKATFRHRRSTPAEQALLKGRHAEQPVRIARGGFEFITDHGGASIF